MWKKWREAGAAHNKVLTLEETIKTFPPKKEKQIPFRSGKEEGTVCAKVSRNLEGIILYVVPGSAKLITYKQLVQSPVEKVDVGRRWETLGTVLGNLDVTIRE